MSSVISTTSSKEIFSFHVQRLPLRKAVPFLFRPVYQNGIPGLKHSESFLTMALGAPVLSRSRYQFNTIGLFAWWSEESALDEFLRLRADRSIAAGWHVRMQLYRRWGGIRELRSAFVDPELARPGQPVVAVTLARLNLLETRRFIKFGKPVERQVRDHSGQTLALAAFRPLSTFSTLSIWESESEMLSMVHGRHVDRDGDSHKVAMQERARKDFHHEFTTMRFTLLKEVRPSAPD